MRRGNQRDRASLVLQAAQSISGGDEEMQCTLENPLWLERLG